MAAKAPRYALHCHHARVDDVTSRIGPFEVIKGRAGFKERVAYIKAEKPKAEVETRLRLFRLLSPAESRRVHEVFAARATAWKAYNDARATALKACESATAAALKAAEVLHREFCLADCPWDGETIFPEVVK